MVNTHLPKAPTFRLQPIQAQPNLHEIQQPKLLVVPRGRHPPIIVSNTEQASHQSGERKGPPLKKKKSKREKDDETLFSFFLSRLERCSQCTAIRTQTLDQLWLAQQFSECRCHDVDPASATTASA